MSGPRATALSTQRPVTTMSAPRSRQRRIGTALEMETWQRLSAAVWAAAEICNTKQGVRTRGRHSCCAGF